MTQAVLFAFLPCSSIALAVALLALRLGRARGHGLVWLGVTQSTWTFALALLELESEWATRILPLGMLQAAAYVQATSDLEATTPRRALVLASWAAAAAVALVAIAVPDLVLTRGGRGAGPAFVGLASIAALATSALLLWIARLVVRSRGAVRRRFIWLGLGMAAGSLGGGVSLGLVVTGHAPPLVAAPLMAISIVAAAVATFDREDGAARKLLRTGLGYVVLTATVSAVGLPLFAWALVWRVGPPSSLAAVASAAWISFAAALPLDPLRALVVEGVGRRLASNPIGVADLARAVAVQETRADHSARLAAVGALTSAVAHELRNPLGVLLIDAKLLERAGADEARVASIRAQVDRAKRFIDDLLRHGMPRPLTLRRVDLGHIVEDAARRACRVRDCEAALACDVHPIEIEVDAESIGDVVTILVDNALASLADAGSPSEVRVSVQTERDGAAITVEDDGPGVAEALASRIFEPFVTGRGRDAKMPGTGLGLAIAKGIVERHGGTIRHAACASGGARFVVVLPWVAKGLLGAAR